MLLLKKIKENEIAYLINYWIENMSDSSIIFIELLKIEREKVERKLFSPPTEDYMETTNKTKESFGEYFDAQYDRLKEMMSNKDRKQHKEWEEEYNNKKRKKENEK